MSTPTAVRTFETHIDLPASSRDTATVLLNQQLADTFDLYSQVKQAHWNVKGKDFIQLHEFFDTLAEEMLGHVDLIAERVTALGETAMGTVRMSAGASSLPEYPDDAIAGADHLTALTARYGAYAASSRAAIDHANEIPDLDTADLFTEVSRSVDKHLWFIEAHLQG